MVTSKAATVDNWLAARAPERQAVFTALREACRTELPDWQERMQWGMPGYGPAGADALVSFNDQKNHIALYVGQAAMAVAGDALAGLDCGKGCVRWRRAEQVDFAAVRAMIAHVREHGRPGR